MLVGPGSDGDWLLKDPLSLTTRTFTSLVIMAQPRMPGHSSRLPTTLNARVNPRAWKLVCLLTGATYVLKQLTPGFRSLFAHQGNNSELAHEFSKDSTGFSLRSLCQS